jgi:RimJ/RimL family protein N-acetyltransferase
MPELEVRRASTAEADDIVDLFDRVVAEERWLGTEPGYDISARRERWRKQIELGGPEIWYVAISHGAIVGALGLHHHDEYGLTLGMCVDAATRGSGIGRALLDAAIDWSSHNGYAQLSLLVFSHNDAAIRLYEKCGFEQREYYKDDVTRRNGEVWDTILMVRSLR